MPQTMDSQKQEGHSGPEWLTCTMGTSLVTQKVTIETNLNKLGRSPLGDATYQI